MGIFWMVISGLLIIPMQLLLGLNLGSLINLESALIVIGGGFLITLIISGTETFRAASKAFFLPYEQLSLTERKSAGKFYARQMQAMQLLGIACAILSIGFILAKFENPSKIGGWVAFAYLAILYTGWIGLIVSGGIAVQLGTFEKWSSKSRNPFSAAPIQVFLEGIIVVTTIEFAIRVMLSVSSDALAIPLFQDLAIIPLGTIPLTFVLHRKFPKESWFKVIQHLTGRLTAIYRFTWPVMAGIYILVFLSISSTDPNSKSREPANTQTSSLKFNQSH